MTLRSHGNSLVVNSKEAIRRTGRCAETKGPGTGWTSQAGVSASPREAEGLCTPCSTPSLPRQRLPLGRCHIPGLWSGISNHPQQLVWALFPAQTKLAEYGQVLFWKMKFKSFYYCWEVLEGQALRPKCSFSFSLSPRAYIFLTVISGSNFSRYLIHCPSRPAFYWNSVALASGVALLSFPPLISDYSLPTSSWAFPCMQSLKYQQAAWIFFFF